MEELLPAAYAFFAGIGFGLFFFGGLWLTVRQLPTISWPVPLMLASFIGRTAVVVVGFYFVMDGHWARMLVCLGGFMLVRLLMVSRMRAAIDAAGKGAI